MKIVQAHNFYRQAGGEDIVVANESKMLLNAGHEVIPYNCYNDEISSYSLLKKLKLFNQLHFNQDSFEACKQFLKAHNPDICHVHNTLHIISPAIYKACKELNIPVVQTLHNYRPICANGMFTRDEKPCEDCVNKSALTAVFKKCYRGSYAQTLAVARMIEKNKKNAIWHNEIDAIICLTDFAKSKFIEGGLPESKIHIKPNFTKVNMSPKTKEDYIVFVGRLDYSKGAHLLSKIASKIKLPIFVIGDGVLKSELEKADNIRFIGEQAHEDTLGYIQKAKALILPSIVYEGMPMTLLEAFALKTPVIASNMGAIATLIDNNSTGLLFQPNDPVDASEKIKYILDNEALSRAISLKAYAEYQLKFTEESNLKSLMSIYQSVVNT